MHEIHPAVGRSNEATIRRARPQEANALSDLSFRSKAYWGYDAAFMEACRADLTITPAEVSDQPIYVMEERQQLIGFYDLSAVDAQEALLHSLFVEPDRIGHGYGKRLWQHAVETARCLGFHSLMLHSEPHAVGFYQAMGAVQIGDVPSTVAPGRLLPLMRVSLDDC
jgi:N-acetylglutamate synthase-like GNAT family acetyltransferase